MIRAIQVDGLKDFQKDLRAANRDFPKQLRVAGKDAAEIVAGRTRSSYARRGGVAPKVARSVKAMGEQRGASVKIGGKRFPFALGAEFGGGKYRKGRPSPRGGYTTQFPPWRGNGLGAGYSLMPTIRASQEEIVDQYADALDAIAKRCFPD